MENSQLVEVHFDEFLISTDSEKLDISAIHDYLSNHSYWAKGIPLKTVKKAIQNSLNFGLYHQNRQIGFARIISDLSTVAYLGDVYLLEGYRGQGLSSRLMDVVMSHPDLQGLRRWILLTSSADWLYQKYGFQKVARPEIYMELHNPNAYQA